MKEYKVKKVLDRLQDEAGYATGGCVDRLVFSGLDVHEMLNEIEQAIIEDIHSVIKLEPIGYYNGVHGFLHDKFDKDCYCQGGCSMEAVYTESQVKEITDKLSVAKLQEQLNTAKKALTEISEIIDDDIHECNYGCDNDCEMDGSLNMYSVENVQSVTDSALAAIGGDDE